MIGRWKVEADGKLTTEEKREQDWTKIKHSRGRETRIIGTLEKQDAQTQEEGAQREAQSLPFVGLNYPAHKRTDICHAAAMTNCC